MVNKLKKKIFVGESNNVFKGMLILLMGAGLARIVGLISIPILARIYSPEDYGVLALYTSFIAILAPVMTLRYVQAIPLPKTDVMAFNLFSVCLKLIAFFSLVSALVLAIWGETILGWFNMEALMSWRWLIVLGATGTALYELFSLWATRKKQYKIIAKTQFAQSVIGNIAKISLGLLAFKPSGMIIGQFISQSAGITSFLKSARNDFKIYLPKIQRSKERVVINYYQDFFWFRLPSQFLMVLSVQAPVIMISALYDKGVTGQLSLAMMALSLPVGLIGGAMSKAYYAEIAEIGKNNINKIIKITFSVQKKLFLIGIPLAILVFFLAAPMFELLFGEKWARAGLFASLLAPFVLFQFTSSPLMEVINILGTQAVYLILHSVRVIGLGGIFVFFKKHQIDVDYFVVTISFYLSVFYFLASALVIYLLVRAKKQV